MLFNFLLCLSIQYRYVNATLTCHNIYYSYPKFDLGLFITHCHSTKIMEGVTLERELLWLHRGEERFPCHRESGFRRAEISGLEHKIWNFSNFCLNSVLITYKLCYLGQVINFFVSISSLIKTPLHRVFIWFKSNNGNQMLSTEPDR